MSLLMMGTKHERRYNSTVKTILKFKSPNEIVEEYFQNTSKSEYFEKL